MAQRRPTLPPVIQPRLELQEITIALSPFKLPTVTLKGSLDTVDRRVGRASEAKIITMHITAEGEAFIRSMIEAFGDSNKSAAAAAE